MALTSPNSYQVAEFTPQEVANVVWAHAALAKVCTWRCICVVYRTRFLYIFYAPHVFSYRICYHMPHIEYISYYIFYT